MTEAEKEKAKALSRAFTEGALIEIGKWVIITMIALLLLKFGADYFRVGYDGTDNKTQGERSGVVLRTDYGTGCQYLESKDGFLSPRYNANGKQICLAPTS